MPELPEVHTTAMGLKKKASGLSIVDVWTDYGGKYHVGKKHIKDSAFFSHFKKSVIGAKIIDVSRRAKNVLIHLDNGDTILIHMKMTGHVLYGFYKYDSKNIKDPWEPISPPSLLDPFNRRVHFILTLSNGQYIALSDVRKFAKVTLIEKGGLETSPHLADLGPEPLDKSFDFESFKERVLFRKNKPIKLAIMDQTVIAGVGNIYADESLHRADLHPLTRVIDIPVSNLKKLYKAIRETLSKGIELGGDSMSDYRNINGEKGGFQEKHLVYKRKGQKCLKKGCKGTIIRIVVGSRGTHLCDTHQILFKKSK